MQEQKTSKLEAVFRDSYRQRPIAIRIGWDRALQRHYLAIDYANGKCERLYHSDDDPNVTRYTDLTYFLRYLLSLGVRIPKEAVRAVSAAPLWNFASERPNSGRSRHGASRYARG